MTGGPGKQSRRPGLVGLREKGLRAWSLVLREKVPGTQTPGSEGEGDWVSSAMFLIGETLEACIPGTSREDLGVGAALQCLHP